MTSEEDGISPQLELAIRFELACSPHPAPREAGTEGVGAHPGFRGAGAHHHNEETLPPGSEQSRAILIYPFTKMDERAWWRW
jgi:hypothetical protein